MRRTRRAAGEGREGRRLEPASVWLLLAALGGIVLVAVPTLGAEPWQFRPGHVGPAGPFAWLVRATDGEWNVTALRAAGLLAGVIVALAAVVATVRARWPRWAAITLTCAVCLLLSGPAVALQAGLRESTAPWFHTNDSTYQIELAGRLLREGENPYGHDYAHSGLERFYSLDGSVTEKTREKQVALHHFAYFPGTALTAALWTVLPEPLSDYRFFVLLFTLAGIGVALVLPGPLAWRLAGGAFLAANPLGLRAAWFGTADAPSLVLTVLAFGLVAQRRFRAAAVALAFAVLLKQFAVFAVPFLALWMWRRADRREALRATAIFAGVVAAGILPFVVWDAGAFWADTVGYGGSTYRIVGYGLSGLLLEGGLLDSRTGPYPFVALVGLIWLPATLWLLWTCRRADALWRSAAGFTISVFLLIFLGRDFHGSYLVWPLAGLVTAVLLAVPGREPVERLRQSAPGSPR